MTHSRISDIKRAQKEKLLLRVISQLFYEAASDDVRLAGVSISRVALSPDKGHCHVYFFTPEGKSAFDEKLEIMKLYKPSLRAALAKEIASRYTPEVVFKFDAQFEQHQKLEKILDSVAQELKKDPS
jgi:ribosome-binding factor A